MTIAPDVKKIARKFGVDAALIQAVVTAEGGPAAIIRAVECSVKLDVDRDKREQALEIVCRSAAHAMSDWIKLNAAPDYVGFWGARWAPQGVENDPTNLNQFWSSNVLRLWLGLH